MEFRSQGILFSLQGSCFITGISLHVPRSKLYSVQHCRVCFRKIYISIYVFSLKPYTSISICMFPSKVQFYQGCCHGKWTFLFCSLLQEGQVHNVILTLSAGSTLISVRLWNFKELGPKKQDFWPRNNMPKGKKMKRKLSVNVSSSKIGRNFRI